MDVYNALVIPMNTDNGGVQFEDKGDHSALRTLSIKVLSILNQLNWLWKNLNGNILLGPALERKTL